VEKLYLGQLRHILKVGSFRNDRTKTGTMSVFGLNAIYDLHKGFPLLTTKKMPWKNTVRELLWFLSGSTNVFDLPEATQNWWAPWADEHGELGPIYGQLWRQWPYKKDTSFLKHPSYFSTDEIHPKSFHSRIDQLKEVIENIKKDPHSRRHLMVTWHPGELSNQRLPPCHGIVIQFYVDSRGLSMFTHQRSADMFLGHPVNIASYALLLCMISQVCNLQANQLHYSIGDAHIYLNHMEQVNEQLTRKPFGSPTLFLNPEIKSIDDFTFSDINLFNYESHPNIKAPVSI